MIVPPSVAALFDGDDLAKKEHAAAILATVDDEGRAHLSFLGAGEVLIDGDHVSLTLWAGAHSAAALRRGGPSSLFAAADGIVHEIRLAVAKAPPAGESGTVIARCRAVAPRQHRAPYATVTGLIGFELTDPTATRGRWAEQIQLMRNVAGKR